MSQLLQEFEEGSKLRGGNSAVFILLAMCHHWKFWALCEVLLILFGMCWLPRQRKAEGKAAADCWSSSSEDGGVGEEDDEVEEELSVEEEWKEEDLKSQRDLGLLVGQLGKSLLLKLLKMQNTMEEMAGANPAAANALQRSTLLMELQAEMVLFATLLDNNLAVSSLSCSNARLNGSPRSSLQASPEEYLERLDA